MSEDAKKPTKPNACIRRYDGATYCGRSVSPQEFIFFDPSRAADVYDVRKDAKVVIVACGSCIDTWKTSGKGDVKNFGGGSNID